MKRIGITGNIGSGKSLICKVFEHLGIHVFYSDDEAKLLYLKSSIKQQMVNHFGKEVYFEDGTLNKKLLSYHVFKNEAALHFIESVIYPALNQCFEEWAKSKKSPYVLYESAILFEKSFDNQFDGIIFVSAPESIRIQRTMQRDECSEENVRSRMRLQWDENIKIEKSDFVIYNDGKQMIIPQVLKINNTLKQGLNI